MTANLAEEGGAEPKSKKTFTVLFSAWPAAGAAIAFARAPVGLLAFLTVILGSVFIKCLSIGTLGIARANPAKYAEEALFETADVALNEAKNSGGNKACCVPTDLGTAPTISEAARSAGSAFHISESIWSDRLNGMRPAVVKAISATEHFQANRAQFGF